MLFIQYNHRFDAQRFDPGTNYRGSQRIRNVFIIIRCNSQYNQTVLSTEEYLMCLCSVAVHNRDPLEYKIGTKWLGRS